MRISFRLALLLGSLVLIGCPTDEPDDDTTGDDDVTGDDDTSGDDDSTADDDTSGDDDSTAATDDDGDGWTVEDGDCDDTDPAVHPEAEEGCDGIVHLAAVSRVDEAERDPVRTRLTNVVGTQHVVEAAARTPRVPWVVLASSREVYGQTEAAPVTEDHPVAPLNAYGRSKVDAEAAIIAARGSGVNAAVVRLTNLYGALDDYPGRVVPAFLLGALQGETLRLDGAACTLDLLHIDDAVAGIEAVIGRLESGDRDLPVVQLVSGVGVTLGELAQTCADVVGRPASIVEKPPGEGKVRHFVGDPTRAGDLLDWRPRIELRQGLQALAGAFSGRLEGQSRSIALGMEAR